MYHPRTHTHTHTQYGRYHKKKSETATLMYFYGTFYKCFSLFPRLKIFFIAFLFVCFCSSWCSCTMRLMNSNGSVFFTLSSKNVNFMQISGSLACGLRSRGTFPHYHCMKLFFTRDENCRAPSLYVFRITVWLHFQKKDLSRTQNDSWNRFLCFHKLNPTRSRAGLLWFLRCRRPASLDESAHI